MCFICKLMLQITKKERKKSHLDPLCPGKAQEQIEEAASFLTADYFGSCIPQSSPSSIIVNQHNVLQILPPKYFLTHHMLFSPSPHYFLVFIWNTAQPPGQPPCSAVQDEVLGKQSCHCVPICTSRATMSAVYEIKLKPPASSLFRPQLKVQAPEEHLSALFLC